MNKNQKNPSFGRPQERGAAMVIALVMLLVLTLLATASARMTLMEERMTGNTQDRNIAFQAAEAGLRDGEDQVQEAVLPDFDLNQEGLYVAPAAGIDPLSTTVDWTDNDDVLFSDDLEEATASFIVEQLQPVPEPGETLIPREIEEGTYYRVTSRGVGVTGNAIVTLQTTFKR